MDVDELTHAIRKTWEAGKGNVDKNGTLITMKDQVLKVHHEPKEDDVNCGYIVSVDLPNRSVDIMLSASEASKVTEQLNHATNLFQKVFDGTTTDNANLIGRIDTVAMHGHAGSTVEMLTKANHLAERLKSQTRCHIRDTKPADTVLAVKGDMQEEFQAAQK